MSYYNVCARCGANLDPGERCDCGAAVSVRSVAPGRPMRTAGGSDSFLQAVLPLTTPGLLRRYAAKEKENEK